jgi:hypothetical protein
VIDYPGSFDAKEVDLVMTEPRSILDDWFVGKGNRME